MIVLLMMRRTTAMIPTTTMTTTGRRHRYWDSYVMNKVMRDDVRALFNDSCRIAEHTNQQIKWNTCWSIQLERSVITDYWKQADWQMETRSNNDKTCSQFPKKYRHPIYEYWLYNYSEWCTSDGWFNIHNNSNCHKQLKRDKHYGMSHIPGVHMMFDILKNMRETKTTAVSNTQCTCGRLWHELLWGLLICISIVVTWPPSAVRNGAVITLWPL